MKATVRTLTLQGALVRAHWTLSESLDEAKASAPHYHPFPITPLAQALEYAPDAVQPILDMGISADDLNCPPGRYKSWKGSTPLMAAMRFRPEWVPVLLELGADPNVLSGGRGALHEIDDANVHHLPALLAAGASFVHTAETAPSPLAEVAWRHPHLVPALLSHGADINANNDFGTALGYAVSRHSMASIRMLLAEGADPNLGLGWKNRTPLMRAMHPWFEEDEAQTAIGLLLAAGANPFLVDEGGRTAAQMETTVERRAYVRRHMAIFKNKWALEAALPMAGGGVGGARRL
jgi:hypothetical protein